MVAGHSHREVPAPHRLQRVKQFLRRIGLAVGVRFAFGATTSGRSGGAEITHEIPLKQMRALIRANESAFCAPSNRAASLKSSEIPKLLQMFRFPKPTPSRTIRVRNFCSQTIEKIIQLFWILPIDHTASSRPF
jgi:hypothetical protein